MSGTTGLSGAKRALLERALRGGLAPAAPRPIPRRPPGQPAPLSIGQEQVWFLSRLSPDHGVYNEGCTVRKRGPVDLDALRRAFAEVVRRHEIWRTSFPVVDGAPVQRVHPPPRWELPLTDLAHLAPADREPEAVRLATEDASRPYDLEQGPLVRPRLVRLAGDDHRLYLAMHHMVFDGVSLYRVLMPELVALYDAFAAGRPSPLPEPELQYGDFAAWQRSEPDPSAAGRLAYWRGRLDGQAGLELPLDRERPSRQRFRGAVRHLEIDPELVAALKALAAAEGASLFMTLAAAFAVLLHRYTGRTDVVFGTPVDDRHRPELQSMIGFCLNAVVLATDLSGDPTFREALARTRETTLAALANEVPFERLVRELQPDRDLSRNPLFQVMFGLEPPLPPVGSDWSIHQMDVGVGTAKFDLYLEQDERPEGHISCRFVYDTDLFDADTVAGLAGHWRTLLAGIAADPGRRVSELPLLTGAERRRVLLDWNATGEELPALCAHELVGARAARTPEAVAVQDAAGALSYGELERRANRLAHHLRGLGVGPDVPVGLCLERSAEMVVAALAILKAGGAYLPLDPRFPAARLASTLDDAGAPVLVTEAALEAVLPGGAGRVCVDRDREAWESRPDTPPDSGVGPDHLAYVIYTSGSTGRPKGVEVPHRSLVNFLRSMAVEPGLGPHDVLVALTTVAFDIAGLELWLPLTAGARVVVAPAEVAADGRRLAGLLDAAGATLVQATPATWRMLVDAGWEGSLGLTALCGGEAVPADLAEALLARCGRLYDVYGPTETTIWSTLGRLAPGRAVGIGRPLANTVVHVLDDNLQPVPPRVPGELFIGGAGLARGYHARAGLTAERFLPSPFRPGERLYRTGDLARWRSDGTLEYLGRRDHQLKLRGFRIEPGEVEAALLAHPDVARAVVVARGDEAGRPGDRRLVGYLVASGAGRPDPAALRAHLRRTLPEYMVPGAFVWLDALPLTPNGKLDRRALPAPDAAVVRAASGAPRSPVEAALTGIWAAALGQERVGVEDDFFDLGGHSLLATRLLARVRDTFGVDLPVRELFAARTPAAMASLVEAARPAPGPAPPPLVPAPRPAEPELSFAQQRLWFLDQLVPDTPLYTMALALRLVGDLDADALARALGETVRRHEALRTSFPAEDGRPFQAVAGEAGPELERPAPDGRPLEEVLGEVLRRPFDLARGPLFRATLLATGEREHVLVLTMHHAVADAWSLGVLARELRALYPAFAAGRPSPLPELPLQYADFATWQRSWLRGEVLARQLDYWRARLAGCPPLELPTDRPRPRLQSHRGAWRHFELDPALTAALRAFCAREGVTPFMILLAAFEVLLSRYTGQRDFAVGTPVASRDRAEVEGLVGLFINTLVLRADLRGDPSFREVLRRVRDCALGAYAHRDLPFEQLVEALEPARDLGRSPVFQVMCQLDNSPPEELDLPGLEVTSLPVDTRTAKYDLTLGFRDDGRRLRAGLEFCTDLFEPATVERLVAHYLHVLEAALADPASPVSELPLLGEAERHRLLADWNRTSADYPRGACVHDLVAAQAVRTPPAVAVATADGRRSLTYAALDAAANRLARHLRALGAGPGQLVGVCLDRGPDMVTALLAVLKAGAGYVPLDPAYPAERLAFMLEDSGLRVLLTAGELAGGLPRPEHVVRLDRDAGLWSELPETAPDVRVDPEHVAYVIYTSGSTGRPKGVQVPHRALVNFLASMRREPGLGPGDVLGAVTTLSFDIAALELFLPLTVGARVVLLSREEAADGHLLRRRLAAAGATVVQATPATWQMLLDAGWQGGLRVLCGGEALSADLASRLLATGAEVWNLYGPTETTVWSTAWRVTEVPGDAAAPLGRPIANTAVYLLDRAIQPVPAGVAGEVHIGGDGLALGYLRRPGLTAERFVPSPFAAGQRLYRTGDLARWHPDGTLRYLGRADDQVKVRGFRIEPGEIEAVLRADPAVREAAVVAREVAPGDVRLVAYVAGGRDGDDTLIGRLRQELRRTLPDHLVPSSLVRLDALPRTPNGKLDRRALPAPDRPVPAAGGEPAAPRTSAEEVLAGLFAELLGLERVGVRDSFFELGGHSLLAVRLLAEVERLFGRRPPLATFLQEGVTVEGLARMLERQASTGSPLLVRAQPRGDRPPLFFLFSHESALLSLRNLLPAFGPDQPVYGLLPRLRRGRFDRDGSVESLAAELVSAVREVQPRGSYHLCGHSFAGLVAYELAARLHADGERIAFLGIVDAVTPAATARILQERLSPRMRLRRQLQRGLRGSAAKLWEVADREARAAFARILRLQDAPLEADEFDYEGALALTQRYRPTGFDSALWVFASRSRIWAGPRLGWDEVHRGPISCHPVPGDHLSMLKEPDVAVLAAELAGRLAESRSGPAPG